MKDKQIKYGIVLSYIYVGINVISGLLFTPFLIGSLGKSQYGLYEIVVSLASNMSILNFGMSDCIIKFVSTFRAQNNKQKQGEIIGDVLKILYISAFIAMLICIFVYLKFDTIYANSLTADECKNGKILLFLSSINLIISLPGSVFSNVLSAYEKFAATRGINIIRIIVRITLIIIFINFSASALTVLLVDTILNIILILVNYILMRHWLNVKIQMKSVDKTLFKKILSFSGYTVFFVIAREIQWQTDKTIIGLRLNTSMVTIYAAGSKVSGMFNQLGYTLSGMFLPRVIGISEEGGHEIQYRKYMVAMGRMILPLVLGVMIAYAFLGKAFITLWMGPGYDLAFFSSFIMMMAVFLPMLQDTGVAILKARDRQRAIAIICLLSSIVNIILTWATVEKYGIVAASVMTFISSYCINVLGLNIILKIEIKLKVFKFFKDLFKGTGMLLSISVFYFAIIKFLKIDIYKWNSFFIISVIYVCIYVISLYFFYLTGEQKTAVRKKLVDFRHTKL